MALWIGNDLDDPARIEELRRHVAICPNCRVRAKSLQSSMVLLGATDPDPTFDRPESLWPELNARIDYLEKTPKNPPPYGRWAVGLACGAGLSAGIWLWVNRPAPLSDPPPSAPVSKPVAAPPSHYTPGSGTP